MPYPQIEDGSHFFRWPPDETIRALTMFLLVALSFLLILIHHFELPDYAFYLHFLYMPIVLGTFWWGKRGVLVAGILGVIIITVAAIRPGSGQNLFSAGVEAVLFLMVALLVGILSDEKSAALEKEVEFKQDTAHYFFNPLCIAEGYLDLTQRQAPDNLQQELEKVQTALERIKKVVINAIEHGEIHE